VPDWEFHQRTDASFAARTPVRARLVVLEAGNSLRRLLTRYVGDVDIAAVEDMAAALQELGASPSQALLINDASPSETLDRLDAATLPFGVPVVACSVPGADESAHALGVAGYLVKPISKEALLAALDRLNLHAGTLLIVDDEPDALRLLQRMLHSSGRGYRVLRARDGQEALKLLGQYRPDVMLLDLVMPNMDGFQLLRIRSQDAELQGIPVIVISARDPLGQPIFSRALAVTRRGGLSVHALLSCIRAITQVLAVPGQPADAGRGLPTSA
jgi:CheY-like chemotaxis protein